MSRLRAELDVALRQLHDSARLLVGAITHSDPAERERLIRCVEKGEHAKPGWEWQPVEVDRALWKRLERARQLAEHVEASAL